MYKSKIKKIEDQKTILDKLIKREYDSSSPTSKEIEDFKILQLSVEEIKEICGNIKSTSIASKLLEMDEKTLKKICRYVNVILQNMKK